MSLKSSITQDNIFKNIHDLKDNTKLHLWSILFLPMIDKSDMYYCDLDNTEKKAQLN
jgi:hypothetical protein